MVEPKRFNSRLDSDLISANANIRDAWDAFLDDPSIVFKAFSWLFSDMRRDIQSYRREIEHTMSSFPDTYLITQKIEFNKTYAVFDKEAEAAIEMIGLGLLDPMVRFLEDVLGITKTVSGIISLKSLLWGLRDLARKELAKRVLVTILGEILDEITSLSDSIESLVVDAGRLHRAINVLNTNAAFTQAKDHYRDYGGFTFRYDMTGSAFDKQFSIVIGRLPDNYRDRWNIR